MSKKHFIELADCLKAMKPATQLTAFDDGRMSQWRDTVDELATFCRKQNPNFMRDRWLAYINGECGKSGGRIAA